MLAVMSIAAFSEMSLTMKAGTRSLSPARHAGGARDDRARGDRRVCLRRIDVADA
jgi:hypothetical protein